MLPWCPRLLIIKSFSNVPTKVIKLCQSSLFWMFLTMYQDKWLAHTKLGYLSGPLWPELNYNSKWVSLYGSSVPIPGNWLTLGARTSVPSRYITSTLQGNGQCTMHVPTWYITNIFRIFPAGFPMMSPTRKWLVHSQCSRSCDHDVPIK